MMEKPKPDQKTHGEPISIATELIVAPTGIAEPVFTGSLTAESRKR